MKIIACEREVGIACTNEKIYKTYFTIAVMNKLYSALPTFY